MAARTGLDDEVVVHLETPAELFTVDRSALLTREGRTVAGIDELVGERLARSRVRRQARIVLTLPGPQIRPETAEVLTTAVHRWCRSRFDALDRERRAVWRQGLWSLRGGTVLFLVGLFLSAGFLQPDVDEFWQDLLGNGVFLVLSWIGLWYPLDLLFFARQPLAREMRILDTIARLPIVVTPRD